MNDTPDYTAMLAVAIDEARQGLAEGGIPIGAALFHRDGSLLGRGHNRRVQEDDPSVHAETDAFRKAGRQRSYRDTLMVTTLAPCWYCSGLVVQFGIGTVVVGESSNFRGGIDWLRERGVAVIELDSEECRQLLGDFITAHPDLWCEDIGEERAAGSETPVKFADILDAFEFVSFGSPYDHEAYLCRETGAIYYHSEVADEDEPLPDDIDEGDKYIVLPHKNELDLGKPLALNFAAQHLPAELDRVERIFSKAGAYSRFKGLLETKGMLDRWYEFEAQAQESELRAWCEENSINVVG